MRTGRCRALDRPTLIRKYVPGKREYVQFMQRLAARYTQASKARLV